MCRLIRPGWHRWQHVLPHWPLRAVDRTLADRGIPPGIVRADVALRPYHQPDRHEKIYPHLVWDVSRTRGRGGVRLAWDDETGWSYAKLGTSAHDVLLEATVTPLHRVLAGPDDVAAVAEGRCTTGVLPKVSTQGSGAGRPTRGPRSRSSADSGPRNRRLPPSSACERVGLYRRGHAVGQPREC
jgi:hypothetical protein